MNGSATGCAKWQRLDPAAVTGKSLLSLAYLVIFGPIVALSAYVYLLRETTAASVSTYAFVNPVIALFLGWLVGEPLNTRSFAGAGLVIGAVVLIHWTRTVKVKATEAPEAVAEPVPARLEMQSVASTVACASEP